MVEVAENKSIAGAEKISSTGDIWTSELGSGQVQANQVEVGKEIRQSSCLPGSATSGTPSDNQPSNCAPINTSSDAGNFGTGIPIQSEIEIENGVNIPVATPVFEKRGINVDESSAETQGDNVNTRDNPEVRPWCSYNILSSETISFWGQPVPSRLNFYGFLGSVKINFSAESFVTRTIHVQASLFMSSMKISIPRGVAVIVKSSFGFCSATKVFKQSKTSSLATSSLPIKIILEGVSILSSIKVTLDDSAPPAVLNNTA